MESSDECISSSLGHFWSFFIFFTPYSHLLGLPLHLCWDTWRPTGRRGSVPCFDLFSSFGLDTFNLSIHKFTLSLLLNPDRYRVIFITDILLFIFMVIVSSSLLRLPAFEALPLYFSFILESFLLFLEIFIIVALKSLLTPMSGVSWVLTDSPPPPPPRLSHTFLSLNVSTVWHLR